MTRGNHLRNRFNSLRQDDNFYRVFIDQILIDRINVIEIKSKNYSFA